MKITYNDLMEFLDEIDLEGGTAPERDKDGKLLDPRQRAILARMDRPMLDRVRTVNRWLVENLDAMRGVLADINVVLEAHGVDKYADNDPMLEHLPEHARIFVDKKLQHVESLRITHGHFEHLDVAEPDLGYAELP